MDYQVAIPSYKRAEVLKNQTLKTLTKFGVSPDRITIFVANEEEHGIYLETLGNNWNIVTGVIGKVQQQQFYHRWYPEGTPLLNLDDDISNLMQRTPDGKLEEYTGTIDELVETAFKYCEEFDVKLWGITPVANGFFMNDTVTVGLRLICGNFYGNYAGDLAIMGEDRDYFGSSGDDWETSIRSYLQNGAVLRFDYICPKTKYWAGGGIDAELKERGVENRQDDNTEALANIVSRYPDLAKLVKKANNVTNIRLKTVTYCKIPKGT